MEPFGKILEFVGKFSWAVFAMIAFVLFIPDDVAKQLGFYIIRTTYKGYWWIGLVLSGALWIGALFKYLDERLFDGWLAGRRSKRQNLVDQKNLLNAIRLRLNSLDGREQLWIKYCLFHNTQTVTARLDDPTAQSLVNKKILMQGSGSMLNLPFHIRDNVWRLLIEEKEIFLPEMQRKDPGFIEALEAFRKSLHPSYF